MKASRNLAVAVGVAAVISGLVAAQLAQARPTAARTSASPAASGCSLGANGNPIKHLIYLQFDNVHFRRDRADVPSDLEQMPHLLNFLTGNGTVLTNDHTILISHTAGGILSSLTGLYPDRNGQTVSNSYGFYRPDSSVGFSSSFKYWTDQVDAVNDPKPNMVTDGGRTRPRRGCPSPAPAATSAGWARPTSSSRTRTPTRRVTSPACSDRGRTSSTRPCSNAKSTDPKVKGQTQTDFVGIAIHCGNDPTSSKCVTNDQRPRRHTGRRAGPLHRFPGVVRREVRRSGHHWRPSLA